LVLEIAGVTLGLREGVLTLIALVAIYMIFVILRMRRLQAKEDLSAKAVETLAPAPVVALPEADELPAPEARLDWEGAVTTPVEEALYRALEQEVLQLRDEVDSIRGELAALREDMLHDLAHMRAAQTVSPIYGDAMQMAAAGYDAVMIAERCGIARAEAELVIALANSQNS
jgi:fumarylacetoacetate (FAA) hydrolase family protein